MVESISIANAVTPEATVRVLRGQEPVSAITKNKPEVLSEPPKIELADAVSSIESFISSHARELEFHIDEASGRTVVTVREQGSGDVIRQIPSEEILAVAADIEAALNERDASGVLLQTRI